MPADFLETIETIRAEEAGVTRLFQGEGRSIRGLRRDSRDYQTRFDRALDFTAAVIEGKRPFYHFREAMTTSDFPLLFGDILDRTLLGGYQETPYSWNQIVRQRTVRDFRTIKQYYVDGAENPLSVVPEQTEYPEAGLSENFYEQSISKFGRRMAFSWEAMINDDLDALKDIPTRFGRAARRTEEKAVTELFVTSAGPNPAFFTVGNNNILTGNPALTITALQAAMTQLATHVDAGGDPISVEMMTLWVPPSLEIPAMNIANAVQLNLGIVGTDDVQLVTANWMRSRFRIAVGPYMTQVDTTHGLTSWYLFASPQTGRPAGQIAHLVGHETPEVWIKSPNAQRAGGGTVDSMEGDFDTDSIEYRVRLVLGTALIDPKAAIASNGSGS